MKKKLLLALPVLAGVLFAQLVSSWQDRDVGEIVSPGVEVPSGRNETLLTGSVLSGSDLVGDHLIKSQALFSKAIELSSKNTLEEASSATLEVGEKNERIVELINEAVTEATQAIVSSPQDSRGYEQRGKIYKTIEGYLEEALPAALRDYQQAARLNPRQVSYFEQIADILLKMDRKPEAVEAFKKCVYVNPTDPQSWYKLAKLEADLGMLWEAKESYGRILPLLVNEAQKETVKTEIQTIEKLIVQAGGQNDISTSSEAEEERREIVFPSEPPKMEAKITAGVIIAEPNSTPLESEEGEIASNALSGKAVLAAGEEEIKIENSNLVAGSQVYLAAEDDLDNEVLRVKSKSVGGDGENGWFVVSISKPLQKSVNFRWWVIN